MAIGNMKAGTKAVGLYRPERYSTRSTPFSTDRLVSWSSRLFIAWLLIIFSAAIIWPETGPSQLLTVDKLLEDIAANRPKVEILEASYEFSSPGSGVEGKNRKNTGRATGPAKATLVRETVYFRAPDKLRLNLSWPDREEVFLAANLSTLALTGDQTTATPWPQPLLLYRLLLETDPLSLRRLLEAFDFQLDKISQEDNQAIIILGAGAGDLSLPQAWFDRQTLNLTRLILKPAEGRPGYDIGLEDYKSHISGLSWPYRLRVRTNTKPETILVLNLKNLSVNQPNEREKLDLDDPSGHEFEKSGGPGSPPTNPDLIEIRKKMEWLEKKIQ